MAVIGSGASSIQTVPNMQPHAKHLDVFVRTGVWFVKIANNYGANHEYTDEQKEIFHKDPTELVKHAKSIENQVNGLWGTFYKNSKAQAEGQKLFKARMAEFIKDERLLNGFTPKWSIGCRRVTPGDPYMIAIQKPNVDVHFTAVNKITEDGVVGEDGVERKVDTIVCATGFDVSYRPRFPVVGQNGTDLADKWKICPEGYLGLAIPEFPNFITFIGPNWPVENVSMTTGFDLGPNFCANLLSRAPSWALSNTSRNTPSKRSRSSKRSTSAPLLSSNPSPTPSMRTARNGSGIPSGLRTAAAYVEP